MATRMDEVWQAQLEQEQQWQATLAADPAYLAWLDELERKREAERERLIEQTNGKLI